MADGGGAAEAAVDPPPLSQNKAQKQKTGACHKCSGVIKHEGKATVCPKCSCRFGPEKRSAHHLKRQPPRRC